MVKLHGQCNAPGEVIGVTLKRVKTPHGKR